MGTNTDGRLRSRHPLATRKLSLVGKVERPNMFSDFAKSLFAFFNERGDLAIADAFEPRDMKLKSDKALRRCVVQFASNSTSLVGPDRVLAAPGESSTI